jgi:MFS family permease
MTTSLVPRPVPDGQTTRPNAFGPAGLTILLLGLAMAVGDFFIVNVALPSIARTLSAPTALLELVVAGYGTVYAVLLVPGGRLGDQRGRLRTFQAGIAGFTFASVLCGLAPVPELLVAARVLQGAFAALLVPQVLAIIQASLEGAARGRALAVYGATLGAAAVVGQVLGGILVEANLAGLAWRPIFLVNVPVGLAVLLFASRSVPENRAAAASHLDVRGAVLLGAAILAILIPATLGRQLGWPAWSLAMLPIAPIALGLAVRHGDRLERAGLEPLLPPSLLRLPGLRAGLAVAVALFIAAGGFFLTIALTLQDGLGLTPLDAGLTMVPYAGAFLLMSLAGPRVAARLGSRIVRVGGAMFAIGMALIALAAIVAAGRLNGFVLAPALVVAGLGQGAIVAPLIGIAMTGVPPKRAGAASGLFTTTIQASLAIGAALIGLLYLAVLGQPGDALDGIRQQSNATTALAVAATVQAVLGLGVVWQAGRLPVATPAARHEVVAEAA